MRRSRAARWWRYQLFQSPRCTRPVDELRGLLLGASCHAQVAKRQLQRGAILRRTAVHRVLRPVKCRMMFAIAVCAFACVISGAEAQSGKGFMKDLGYAEPEWQNILQSQYSDPIFTIKDTEQIWGTVAPFTGGGPLCKYAPDPAGGRGTCKTDVSWLHSAIGMTKTLFTDPLALYIMKFQVHGACYRSTQVRLPSSLVTGRFLCRLPGPQCGATATGNV
jgi:hypothetical protein